MKGRLGGEVDQPWIYWGLEYYGILTDGWYGNIYPWHTYQWPYGDSQTWRKGGEFICSNLNTFCVGSFVAFQDFTTMYWTCGFPSLITSLGLGCFFPQLTSKGKNSLEDSGWCSSSGRLPTNSRCQKRCHWNRGDWITHLGRFKQCKAVVTFEGFPPPYCIAWAY